MQGLCILLRKIILVARNQDGAEDIKCMGVENLAGEFNPKSPSARTLTAWLCNAGFRHAVSLHWFQIRRA